MKRRDLPNLISVCRILLVIPLIILFQQERFLWVFLVFVVAGLSDALDGYLARRYAWTSWLGAILDPIGDKLLLSTTYLCLAVLGFLPTWLALLVVLRDVVIIGGATAYFVMFGRYTMAPTLASKLNTVLQMLLPFLVLLDITLLVIPSALIAAVIYAVTITTIISGGHYVWRWGRKARVATRGS